MEVCNILTLTLTFTYLKPPYVKSDVVSGLHFKEGGRWLQITLVTDKSGVHVYTHLRKETSRS